jgi:hypothetical protein
MTHKQLVLSRWLVSCNFSLLPQLVMHYLLRGYVVWHNYAFENSLQNVSKCIKAFALDSVSFAYLEFCETIEEFTCEVEVSKSLSNPIFATIFSPFKYSFLPLGSVYAGSQVPSPLML